MTLLRIGPESVPYPVLSQTAVDLELAPLTDQRQEMLSRAGVEDDADLEKAAKKMVRWKIKYNIC